MPILVTINSGFFWGKLVVKFSHFTLTCVVILETHWHYRASMWSELPTVVHSGLVHSRPDKNISFLCSAWFRQYHKNRMSSSSSSSSSAAAAVQCNCHNTNTDADAAVEKLHHRFTFFFINAFGGPMILNVVLTNRQTMVLRTRTTIYILVCIQCHYLYLPVPVQSSIW